MRVWQVASSTRWRSSSACSWSEPRPGGRVPAPPRAAGLGHRRCGGSATLEPLRPSPVAPARGSHTRPPPTAR